MRRPGARRAAFLALVVLAPQAVRAGDARRGREKAIACTVCHGPAGISQVPDAPHLAGQPEPYLAQQLKAYRSGKRVHEVMNVIAKPLTDEDIADLAAWFSEIVVRAEVPRSAP
jgi:cytochrome c553